MKPSNPSTSTLDDKRRRAYQAGGRITRDRMTREAPMNAEALDAIETSDIVVVEGLGSAKPRPPVALNAIPAPRGI